MKTKDVENLLSFKVDSVNFKNGIFTVKRYFFYSNKNALTYLIKLIEEKIPQANIINIQENWYPWPKESFYKIQFTLGD